MADAAAVLALHATAMRDNMILQQRRCISEAKRVHHSHIRGVDCVSDPTCLGQPRGTAVLALACRQAADSIQIHSADVDSFTR